MSTTRDPGDLERILDSLRADVDDLKKTMISRWGRIPHVAVDPVSPPDGAEWIRSDNNELRWRANGVTSPSDWTAVTFANSWVDFGSPYNVCQYRKIGDIVFLRGLMKSGTVGATAFTLPAGFRPPVAPADLYFGTVSNALFGTFTISSAGVFTAATGSNVWFSINCHFSTSTL